MANKVANRTIKIYIDGKDVDASVSVIQGRVRKLTAEMKKLTIGSEEYNKKAAEISRLNSILDEHKRHIRGVNTEQKSLGSQMSKISDSFNKYFGMLSTFVAGLLGVSITVRKCVNDYAAMQEAEAQVIKYTGMTSDLVKELNDDFKNMDTRTSRERLNELAGDAGKLGIKSKKAVEEFVDGADKINVALGDDLGEDATKNVGKLAMMFGEDQRLGLRGAMLATGSALNELSQNSSAAGGYLVDFTARTAGVGKQVGLTQAQIMGYAAVLDANMQQDETASTAFSQLLTKMYQEPSKFAKLAGQDVKNFTKLLKVDANAALLQFLQSMKSKGGFADLAPMFDGMGLNGTRAIGVLSTMADKLGDVNKMQSLATKAYAEGTSVINEFNVQNNTVQAKIDKAKKQFHDLSIELGEKLLPVAQYAISTGSLMVKGLKTFTDFVIRHRSAIIAITLTIGAYVVTQKLMYLWSQRQIAISKLKAIQMAIEDKLLEVSILRHAVLNGTMKASVAWQKLFNDVLKVNPYALLIAGITALTAAYIKFASASDTATRQRKLMNDIEKEAAGNYTEEINKVQILKSIIEDSSQSYQTRKAAIEEVQQIVPEYHASLTDEGQLINNNSDILDVYCQKLKNAALIQVASAKLAKKQMEYAEFSRTLPKNLTQALFNENLNGMSEAQAAAAANASLTAYRAFKRMDKKYEEDLEFLNNNINARVKENLSIEAKLNKTKTKKVTTNGTGGTISSNKKTNKDKERLAIERAVKAELEKIEAEYNNKRSALKEQAAKGEISSQEELNAKLEALDIQQLEKQLGVARLSKSQIADFKAKLSDLRLKLRQEFENMVTEVGNTEDNKLNSTLAKLEKEKNDALSILENANKNLKDENGRQLVDEENYQKQRKAIIDRYNRGVEEAKKESARNVLKEVKDNFEALQNAQKNADIQNGTYIEKTKSQELQTWIKFLDDKLSEEKLSQEEADEYRKERESAVVEKENEEYASKIEKAKQRAQTIENLVTDTATSIGQGLASLFTHQDDGLKGMLKSILVTLINFVEQELVIAKLSAAIKAAFTPGGVAAWGEIAKLTGFMVVLEGAKAAINSFDTGGFTPSGAWNKPQGIVHSNEFVANRFATSNPNVLPVLNLLDAAQKSGSVSRLTSNDIYSVLPSRNNSVTCNKIPNPNDVDDNGPLMSIMLQVIKTLRKVDERFENPIIAETYVTGKGGSQEAQDLYEKMKNNVKRS